METIRLPYEFAVMDCLELERSAPDGYGTYRTIASANYVKVWHWSDSENPERLEFGENLAECLAKVGREGWVLAAAGGFFADGWGPTRLIFQRAVPIDVVQKITRQESPYIGPPDEERDADFYNTMEGAIQESKEITEEDRERLLGKLEDRRQQETQEPEVSASPPPLAAIMGSGASTVPKGVSNERSDELDLES